MFKCYLCTHVIKTYSQASILTQLLHESWNPVSFNKGTLHTFEVDAFIIGSDCDSGRAGRWDFCAIGRVSQNHLKRFILFWELEE